MDDALTVSQPLGTVAATLRSRRVPRFAHRSDRLAAAWRFACDAYRGHPTEALAHPMAVAALLHDANYPEHVTVAALLHDVVEDTSTQLNQLSRRFGIDVCRLVAQLTEDDNIAQYTDRKAELRERAAAGDDGHVAAIFAADKLARARALNAQNTQVARVKFEHYERTMWAVREHHPAVPFLDELSDEIEHLRERVAG